MKWLQASKGLPHLVIALALLAFFQSKDGFKTVLSFNIIALALAALCQLVHVFSSSNKGHDGLQCSHVLVEEQSKGLTMTNDGAKKKSLAHLLSFYLKDNQLHLLLPMALFAGLLEAFMAKQFIAVISLPLRYYIQVHTCFSKTNFLCILLSSR